VVELPGVMGKEVRCGVFVIDDCLFDSSRKECDDVSLALSTFASPLMRPARG
jgi:hypothetical protein